MKHLFFLVALFYALLSQAQSTHAYAVVKSYPVGGNGGWDYLAVHGGKIYVSHGTQVNIIDEKTGDSVGVIPNTPGIHGIAFDDVANRGYTSNGRSNNITVFNSRTDDTLAKIAVGENPDAILYEPYTKTIITCNGRSKDLSVVDPAAGTVKATVQVGGKPETAVSSGTGMLYVNVEDKNEIVAVDLKTFTVKAHWPLGAEAPTGLAYDPATKRLFAGCEKELVVLDAVSGKRVATLPIGDGCDGVAFSLRDKTVFTSNGGDGTLTAIREQPGDRYAVLGNYPTRKGGRTITMDQQDGSIFIPAADYQPTQPGAGRPQMVPGTFRILVVR